MITAILNAGILKGKTVIPKAEERIYIPCITKAWVMDMREPSPETEYKLFVFLWKRQLDKNKHEYILEDIR